MIISLSLWKKQAWTAERKSKRSALHETSISLQSSMSSIHPSDANGTGTLVVIVTHMGAMRDGTIGAKTVPDLQDTTKQVQEVSNAAFSVNPNIVCMSYGGTIATAKTPAFINQNTNILGFVGVSSIERFACKSSIPKITASYKKAPVN